MESTIVSLLPSCSCSTLKSCAAESECNDAPWCSQHAHRRLLHYKTSMTTYQAPPAEGGSKWSPTPRALLLLLLLLLHHHRNLRLGLQGTLKGVEGEEWLALYLKLSRRHGQRLATTPAAPWVRPLKKMKPYCGMADVKRGKRTKWVARSSLRSAALLPRGKG